MKSMDVIIVGAGPSGLACGIEAQKRDLSCLIVEKGGITDAIRRFPVNMTFFSTPEMLELGDLPFPCVGARPTRVEALCYYRKVVEHFHLNLSLHCRVHDIARQDDGFRVRTETGTLTARHVIIATGHFDDTNRLGVPGEELPHVSHYYDEPYAYAQMDVALIGGRNSAVEAALELYRNGACPVLIHRRENLGQSVKYWVRPDIENRIADGAVRAYFNSRVTEITRHHVSIENVRSGARERIRADFVFPLIGYRPDEQLLRGAGVEMNPDNLIPAYSPETFQTNVPGLYIAGSVACGCETWNIFIENGRAHARPIFRHICHDL